jgi:hypothetical protein
VAIAVLSSSPSTRRGEVPTSGPFGHDLGDRLYVLASRRGSAAQNVSGHSCHKQRKQRAFRHPLVRGSLALTNVLPCLCVLFSCLSDVLLATVVHLTSRSRRLIGNVVQSVPHLIQNLLG